jgi:hypothetical protein
VAVKVSSGIDSIIPFRPQRTPVQATCRHTSLLPVPTSFCSLLPLPLASCSCFLPSFPSLANQTILPFPLPPFSPLSVFLFLSLTSSLCLFFVFNKQLCSLVVFPPHRSTAFGFATAKKKRIAFASCVYARISLPNEPADCCTTKPSIINPLASSQINKQRLLPEAKDRG